MKINEVFFVHITSAITVTAKPLIAVQSNLTLISRLVVTGLNGPFNRESKKYVVINELRTKLNCLGKGR